MNKDQTLDALRQAYHFTTGLHEAYEAGTGEYTMVSLREVLYTLGFAGAEADEAITTAAERGFNYCIDPIVPSPRDGKLVLADACHWGADQLASRLSCVI